MSRRSQKEISVLVPPNLVPLTSEDPRRIGPYLVIGRIGSGRTGTVYAAVTPSGGNDPLVTVKTLHAAQASDDRTRAALDQRLHLLSGVDRRCYVPPIAFDTSTTPPWLAMMYVSGVPLAQYARRHGAMGQGRLIALAAGLSEGLSALHLKNIAHGDLKPSNVLLSSSGPRILDCALPGDESLLRHSAAWMSPERHAGAPQSPSSDVFAWGAVVAFAATGRLPFGIGEPEVVAARVRDEEPDLDGVPTSLLPLLERALDKNPDNRPSVRELLGSTIAIWESTAESTEEKQPTRGTAVTRVLAREWQGIVEPARLPRMIQIDAREPGQRRRTPLVMGGALLAAALVIGGVVATINAVFPNDDPDDQQASSPSPETAEAEEDSTPIVRFDPTEQEGEDGPWVYTRVEPMEGGLDMEDAAFLTPRDWSDQWVEIENAESEEAVIPDDAEVYCANFCVPGPGHISNDNRGTYEMNGQEFTEYLNWGDVVIAEVEFTEDSTEGEREIAKVTEVFPAPPEE